MLAKFHKMEIQDEELMGQTDACVKNIEANLMEAELVHAFGKKAETAKLRAIAAVRFLKHPQTPTSMLHPILRQEYNDALPAATVQYEADQQAASGAAAEVEVAAMAAVTGAAPNVKVQQR